MADWFGLHLRFDTPALREVLSRLHSLLKEADEDAPIEAITARGTPEPARPDTYWTVHRQGEWARSWRSPYFEVQDGAWWTALLGGLGLSGMGFFQPARCVEHGALPDDARFTFGDGPIAAYWRARTARATRVGTAFAAECAALRALETAARAGEDEALAALAQALRGAMWASAEARVAAVDGDALAGPEPRWAP